MADPISSFSGIASGMDYKALVAQILTVERRPAVKLEATVAANDRRKAQLDQFRAALEALRTAAAALGPDGTALGSVQVLAPGTAADGRTVLAATAATGAPPGSYAVTVTRLAAAQKTVGGWGSPPARSA
jgi:flagellar hook-associated protein 2